LASGSAWALGSGTRPGTRGDTTRTNRKAGGTDLSHDGSLKTQGCPVAAWHRQSRARAVWKEECSRKEGHSARAAAGEIRFKRAVTRPKTRAWETVQHEVTVKYEVTSWTKVASCEIPRLAFRGRHNEVGRGLAFPNRSDTCLQPVDGAWPYNRQRHPVPSRSVWMRARHSKKAP
jgi:hypothetical protein